ncbi:hypothetical protein [Variovorax saccharolyticus]|uniref:hypothetical protein n=1 Tax=Variovorax saccharolyticus TaxID=3053516 RepID=UPI002576C65C|nr:hypothetical protein [Variovorax sp. J31P216]MDM0026311.1 hypothetical protein [Variovorax sp. J31P216]
MKRFLGGCMPLLFGLALVACGGSGSGGSPTISVAAVEGSGGTGNSTATVSQTFDDTNANAKPTEPAPIEVRFDPASIITSLAVASQSGAAIVPITAFASNLPSAPLTVFLVDEAGILEPGPHPLFGAGANVFVAVPPFLPTLSGGLSEGVHEGVLKIRFCSDSSCAVEYPVSAASVLPYTVTVTGRV